MMHFMKRPAAIVASAVAAVLAVSTAVAMTVQPVVLDLFASGRNMSQIVTVQNTFSTPLPVELKGEVADFTTAGLKSTGTATDDLLIFPPQAIIEPGRTQSFRVQYVGDPQIAQSKHYYVTVAQLPVKLPETQSAVQVLYNFQVIVNVGVPGARPAVKVTSAEITTEGDGKPRVALNLKNDAPTYGYLSRGSLRVVQYDDSGKEVFRKAMNAAEIQQQIGFGLVGAGRERRILTPIVLPTKGGRIEAEFTPGRI